MSLECAVCLVHGDHQKRTPARTVMSGHALCLDCAVTLVNQGIASIPPNALAAYHEAMRPLAKQAPDVTALPQVGSALHVKQPRSEWDVPPHDLGRRRP